MLDTELKGEQKYLINLHERLRRFGQIDLSNPEGVSQSHVRHSYTLRYCVQSKQI